MDTLRLTSPKNGYNSGNESEVEDSQFEDLEFLIYNYHNVLDSIQNN